MGCLQSQHGALVLAECSRKSLRSFLYRLVLRPYEVDRLCVTGLTSLVHVSSSVKSCPLLMSITAGRDFLCRAFGKGRTCTYLVLQGLYRLSYERLARPSRATEQ